MKTLLKILGIIILVLLVGLFFFVGSIADKQMNVKVAYVHPPISQQAKDLHAIISVADWHSDNLLWDRNPLKRLDHGHVDIPRLIAGNVSLQVFDAVIKTPRGLNYQQNDASSDNVTLLAIANRWPIKAWSSLAQRAIHQSNVLHKASKDSEGRLSIIKTSQDLKSYMTSRITNKNQVAGLLSIEGLHALEGKIENLDRLYDAGYRMMGLTHFFDNEVGGSSAGVKQGGLTEFGKKVVVAMEKKSIIIDLAHASPALISNVMEVSSRPVVVSHTGVKAIYDSPRNLSDDQIRRIASKGGIIGIGFWPEAVGDYQIDSIVRSIKHVADLVGIDHVSLGSDFDGATSISFDCSELVLITDGLIRAGFKDKEIGLVMGGNQMNFLLENLPTQ